MQALIPHPRCGAPPAAGLGAQAERGPSGRLRLAFRLGRLAGLAPLAPAGEGRFVDGLWRDTCFEAFVQPVGAKHYWEFNLAPSLDYALYVFEDYRVGMKQADLLISAEHREADMLWRAELDLAAAADLAWRVGLCAVLKAQDGGLSYWALTHPNPEQPDFHDPDGFNLDLAAP